MVKIKICGITNLEDALAAVIHGADALGFVFYKKSPRYIVPEKARNIARIIPKRILKVGVFVNEDAGRLKRIAGYVGLGAVQLHGNEVPGYCSGLRGLKTIKAFRIRPGDDLGQLTAYRVWGYLFDSFSARTFGGTGKRFDWKLVKQIGRMDRVVFLSGGLNPRNIKRAIKQLHPDWVDASSLLESRAGIKDHKKLKAFIKAVKG